ncbi:hypothetical protein PHYC_01803 [Phycisphaerales bacterium]|nr:hypothetical protein PHYC_01803 [Phycisphaerales bacterium]
MSRFLHIERDPVNQPAATDPLEKATWSSLRIRIGARTVSRVLDKKLNDERSLLYVPLFAVGEWLVNNWWALLHEPCRSEFLPPPDADEPEFSWTKRHCLRAAESDLLLPALYLHCDGRGLRAEWRADSEDALPHMPAFFVDAGWSDLEREPTEQSLARFVADVLERVGPLDDSRARDLREAWSVIQEADAEERAFCVMAGRLGLDPYDPQQIPKPLAATLEQFEEASDPLVQDITMAASPDRLSEQWKWVDNAKRAHKLTAVPPVMRAPPSSGFVRADKFGYSVAQEFRRRATHPADSPLESVPAIASQVLGVPLQVINENHLVGREVKLIVGKSDSGDVQVVGPTVAYEEDERFRVARGLFHVAVAGALGPRLVTDAFTWDQRASRAFAAELIAPQQALKARAGRWADRDTIRNLARDFRASTILIEKQLTNAQVPISQD